MNLEEIVSWSATILGFGLKASPIVLFYQIARGNKKIEIVPEMLIICNVVSAELWFSYWIRIGTKMAPIVSSSVSFVLGFIFSAAISFSRLFTQAIFMFSEAFLRFSSLLQNFKFLSTVEIEFFLRASSDMFFGKRLYKSNCSLIR